MNKAFVLMVFLLLASSMFLTGCSIGQDAIESPESLSVPESDYISGYSGSEADLKVDFEELP